MDVVVMGGGLIGLAAAYELALRGAHVRVFDMQKPGAGASWAGAGILSPYSKWISLPELADFCVESLAAFPSFVEQLRAHSDTDPQLRLNGILEIAYNEEDVERLAARANDLRARNFDVRFLDRAQAHEAEPMFASDVLGALLINVGGGVDNRRLVTALHQACVALGVTVSSDVAVEALEVDDGGVRGVRTSQGVVSAPIVLNAAGAWAGRLVGLPECAQMPVIPIKGQMLALQAAPETLRRVIWFPTRSGNDGYVVPRADGRILVGATVEHAGFDLHVTAEGVHALLDKAMEALPKLRSFPITETWAGVRPGSSDNIPFIGATGLRGYFVAAGHFRYGILLTPATANLIADIIEGRGNPKYTAAFSPEHRRRNSESIA